MKRAIVTVGIVLAALGAVAVRVVSEGRDAITEGDAAMAAKHTGDAIAAWESAARWYLPFAPHVDQAYDRLTALAKASPEHALPAWRAVRRAATATRSVWQPHAADLAAADTAIAKLSAEQPDASPVAGEGVAARIAFHAARLADDPRPSKGAAALAMLGIVCWLVGIGVIAARGLDAAGRLVRRPAMLGAALTVVGVVGWAVGIYNA